MFISSYLHFNKPKLLAQLLSRSAKKGSVQELISYITPQLCHMIFIHMSTIHCLGRQLELYLTHVSVLHACALL